MLHRLCGPPSIPLSFSLAAVLPRRGAYCVSYGTERVNRRPTPSTQRLRLGLPGYLILFAPLAFAPERQDRPREPPSPPVFLLISAHFTATPGIPLSPACLEPGSIGCSPGVEPRIFTPDLTGRLRALYAQ